MKPENVNEETSVQTAKAQPGSGAASGSDAPPQTNDSEKRDWLRLVVMVENTEVNQVMCRILPEEGRRLAERFQGNRIVKCEALQVWAMSHTKEEPPKAEAQQNADIRHGG